MEVHAHSHTPRKKWTHYFWEFFMLFLAVTLGFFVENQREHYVEHKREKQFVQSLYNDIKADTANLNRIIHSRTLKISALDSLLYMMNNPSAGKFNQRIYYYAVGASRTLPYRFLPNDGTIQQLKNSGALRLIRKRTVVDSIAKYDVNVRNLVSQGAVEENLIEGYREAASKMFDALVYDELLDDNMNIRSVPEGLPGLQPFTKRDLFEWNYKLFSVRAINKANRRDARALLRQAENLLALLKKEYPLQ